VTRETELIHITINKDVRYQAGIHFQWLLNALQQCEQGGTHEIRDYMVLVFMMLTDMCFIVISEHKMQSRNRYYRNTELFTWKLI
jgi:DNA-directed RNA polymerase delta subunit